MAAIFLVEGFHFLTFGKDLAWCCDTCKLTLSHFIKNIQDYQAWSIRKKCFGWYINQPDRMVDGDLYSVKSSQKYDVMLRALTKLLLSCRKFCLQEEEIALIHKLIWFKLIWQYVKLLLHTRADRRAQLRSQFGQKAVAAVAPPVVAERKNRVV